MAEYYLISQLPSLDGLGESSPMPITEERFFELCRSLLDEGAQRELEALTLTPPRDGADSGSALVKAWYESERDLRLALGAERAKKMQKTFDTDGRALPIELTKAAREAVDMNDPLAAEKFLNEYRLKLLEALRPTDTFSQDYIFYYGLKLKLIMRIRRFDADAGDTAYRNIYNSILNGERLETIQ